MLAGSSVSWTSCGALALLACLVGCGRHDTALASVRAGAPLGGGGLGGASSEGAASGISGSSSSEGGAAGAAAEPSPICAPSYSLAVDGLSSRYREVLEGKHWVEAEQDCESDGGHLIIIDDEAENAWMATVAAKAQTGNKSTHELAWIGMGDSASEGDFFWVTGPAPSLTFWSSGEPNTAFEDEDCVEMRASAEWNDDRCDAPLIYVCECDGAPSAGQWCDSNTKASCGDCTTACEAEQDCVKQRCM